MGRSGLRSPPRCATGHGSYPEVGCSHPGRRHPPHFRLTGTDAQRRRVHHRPLRRQRSDSISLASCARPRNPGWIAERLSWGPLPPLGCPVWRRAVVRRVRTRPRRPSAVPALRDALFIVEAGRWDLCPHVTHVAGRHGTSLPIQDSSGPSRRSASSSLSARSTASSWLVPPSPGGGSRCCPGLAGSGISSGTAGGGCSLIAVPYPS